MSQIKTAIIGTGGIASQHIQGIQSLGERLQLCAVVDIDAAKVQTFKETHQITATTYTDIAEMLKVEKPDLVQIATPPSHHARISIQCMESGAWVLCEKPLCLSLAELDLIEEAERKTGKFCASVFQMRHGPGVAHIKALIDNGSCGRPLVSLCETLWYRDAVYYEVPWRGKWATEAGGPTVIHGIHAMDQWLYLMGDWVELQSMVGTLDRKTETEDTSLAMVKFASGALGSVMNSILCPRQETRLRMDFQKVTMELKHLYSFDKSDWRFTAASKAHEDLIKNLQSFPDIGKSSHGLQISDILDNMQKGMRPITSGDQARKTLEFLTAIYKSGFSHQPVQRHSITPDDPFYHSFSGMAQR